MTALFVEKKQRLTQTAAILKKPLASRGRRCYNNKALGGVAHLGERLNGIQEVVGSIPIISTKRKKGTGGRSLTGTKSGLWATGTAAKRLGDTLRASCIVIVLA